MVGGLGFEPRTANYLLIRGISPLFYQLNYPPISLTDRFFVTGTKPVIHNYFAETDLRKTEPLFLPF